MVSIFFLDLICTAKYVKYKKVFLFCCKKLDTFWNDFKNAIKNEFSEFMDEVPIEAISITPENAEYQIDDQDKAEIMLNLLPKLDDGMLNCVFKVNTCEPIEMFSLNKFAFLFSIYLFIF